MERQFSLKGKPVILLGVLGSGFDQQTQRQAVARVGGSNAALHYVGQNRGGGGFGSRHFRTGRYKIFWGGDAPPYGREGLIYLTLFFIPRDRLLVGCGCTGWCIHYWVKWYIFS